MKPKAKKSGRPEKLIILYILKILQEHSDENHPLKQKQIRKLLEKEYGITVSEKTIRHNISYLIELGFNIKYPDSENDDLEKKPRLTDIFYVHDFMNGELLMLISSVLSADGLYKKDRLQLIKRLEKTAGKHFHSAVEKTDINIHSKVRNKEIFFTLENIADAISKGRQLSFHYCDCGTDLKLHYRLGGNGKPKVYTVNPYQVVSRNGHFYLLCNLPKYDDLTHFRVDRIKDSTLLDSSLRPLRMLKGFENGIQVSDYLRTHPNLWGGKAERITFQCRQYMMNDIADSFGTDIRIEVLPDDMMRVNVEASEEAMLRWAIQFADAVEILSPKSLRVRIAEILRNSFEKYELSNT